MTKEQEREALKKIQEIIEEAGPESYIGMTFAGIVEQAEENIANDWGICPVKELETAQERISTMQGTEAEKDRTIEILNETLEATQNKNVELDKIYKGMCDNMNEYCQMIRDKDAEITVLKSKLENETAGLETEIINLKAKLYDLMTK